MAKLSIDEPRCLVDRAARMVREMYIETGVRPIRGNKDALRDIEIAVLMVGAGGNDDDDDVKAVLLDLAEMIRTLKIVLDGKCEDLRGDR
ncbi:MAG: hypothetical protein AAAC47_27865 [Pararhizobium sp.]